MICTHLNDFANYAPDLIVEVAHPDITKHYGPRFVAAWSAFLLALALLTISDYFCGSPTALADLEIETSLRTAAAVKNDYGLASSVSPLIRCQ